MSKPLIIILRMADSNQTRISKLGFIVLMVDDHIKISMNELNDGDYSPLVT